MNNILYSCGYCGVCCDEHGIPVAEELIPKDYNPDNYEHLVCQPCWYVEEERDEQRRREWIQYEEDYLTWPKGYSDPQIAYQMAYLSEEGKYITSLVHSCHGAKEIEIAYWKYLTVPKEILEKEIKSQTYVCKGVKE